MQDAISKICGIEPARLHPDASLADLGVDSLAAAEVLVELEIQLGKDLPVDLLRQLDHAKTVRDIAAGLDSVFAPPSVEGHAMIDTASLRAAGTSPAAIASHYDLSDEFFALWLGRDLVYSCALWDDDRAASSPVAQQRKLDFFATALHVRGGRVLDIGCGWGALLNRFVGSHGVHPAASD